jgi:cell filamentation protein
MNNNGRYHVPTSEGYEPGSNEEVLKNLLGITSKEQIGIIEKQELERTELALLGIDRNQTFTARDICDIHELWLSDLYPLAGKYRTVRMEKDGFPFAAPNLIPKLMIDFERDTLLNYTPCHYSNTHDLANAIGIVHVELILIHPFREGNGRVARLIADLMAMQANRPPLNFKYIDSENSKGFKEYIVSIHAGLNKNYTPIQDIIKILLK